MDNLYTRIKARRLELGLTVEQLAKRMGYKDKSSISKIENGRSDIPQAKVEAFAQALETTTAYLMGFESDPVAQTVPPGFEPMPRMVKKPLIGDIACGQPILAQQNITDYLDVPESLHCDFCLRCHGDSMIEAHIQDGDIVYIRCQPQVEDGEIAAVRIDGEATLKRVYYDGQSLTLMPANSRCRPKTYTGAELENIRIEGKAVGFVHIL